MAFRITVRGASATNPVIPGASVSDSHPRGNRTSHNHPETSLWVPSGRSYPFRRVLSLSAGKNNLSDHFSWARSLSSQTSN